MELQVERLASLPPLAWFAEVVPGREVRVVSGEHVEVGDGFIVEGIWDGPFQGGGFHRASTFFGSGLLVEGDEVWLVPSRALVDKLYYAYADDGRVYASNSLAFLLAATGATFGEDENYVGVEWSIVLGVDAYTRKLSLAHPRIHELFQCVFRPVRLSAAGGQEHDPPPNPPLPSFAAYFEALTGALQRIHENSKDPARRKPLRAFCTCSRGYDSPAVCALVRDKGLEAAYTVPRSAKALPAWISRKLTDDDATPILRHLGVPGRYVPPMSQARAEDELAFQAGHAGELGTALQSLMQPLEERAPAILYTGYHGDKVWERELDDRYLTRSVIRGDLTGMYLTEARLWSGFVHAAIPFIYARSTAELNSIAKSEDMRSWTLGTRYDRPIPRRIVEEARVPRKLFGQAKKAIVPNRTPVLPRLPALRREYLRHLQDQFGLNPLAVRAADAWTGFRLSAAMLTAPLRPLGLSLSAGGWPTLRSGGKLVNLRRELFNWANARQSERYRAALESCSSTDQSGAAGVNEREPVLAS